MRARHEPDPSAALFSQGAPPVSRSRRAPCVQASVHRAHAAAAAAVGSACSNVRALAMPADEAGSKRGSQASGGPEIVPAGAANQGGAEQEEGVDLVIEGPDIDPHEDSEEELLQQKHDETDDEEADAQENAEAEIHHKRASFRGGRRPRTARRWLARALHWPRACALRPAALLAPVDLCGALTHLPPFRPGKHWQRTVRMEPDDECSAASEHQKPTVEPRRDSRRTSGQIAFAEDAQRGSSAEVSAAQSSLRRRARTADKRWGSFVASAD